MTDHAEDCALVLYPGSASVKCDCEASDPPTGTDEDDHIEPVTSVNETTIQVSRRCATALIQYRAALATLNAAEERKRFALETLTKALTEEPVK